MAGPLEGLVKLRGKLSGLEQEAQNLALQPFIDRRQRKADQALQEGLLAGLPAQTKSDPALSGALAGEAIRTPAGQGLLQQMSSPNPVIREQGQSTAQNIRDISRQKHEDVLAGEKLINDAVDFQSQQIRKTMAPTVALLEAGADVKNLLAEGTATSSQAAVTRLARALSDDAVREGEQTRIQASTGASDFLLSQFKALGGEGMTVGAVEQFEGTVDALLAERAFNGIGRVQGFDTEAEAQGIKPERRKAMFKTSGLNMRTLMEAVVRGMTPEQIRQKLAESAAQ